MEGKIRKIRDWNEKWKLVIGNIPGNIETIGLV